MKKMFLPYMGTGPSAAPEFDCEAARPGRISGVRTVPPESLGCRYNQRKESTQGRVMYRSLKCTWHVALDYLSICVSIYLAS